MAHIAEHFSSQSIEVCAFDFKGYGKSEGLRGYIGDIEEHINDSQRFVDKIQELYPSKPLFLLGFSLGGLTAFHLGLKNKERIKGIIFLAPALKPHPYYLKYAGLLSILLSKLMPKIKVTRQKKRSDSSAQRNININEFLLQESSLYNKQGLYAGTVGNLIESMILSQQQIYQLDVPFIVFQGGMDKLVDPDIGNILIQKARSEDKSLIFKNDMWHGIPLEPEIEEYKYIMSQWILQRI